MIYLKVIFNAILTVVIIMMLPRLVQMFYHISEAPLDIIIVFSFILAIMVGLVVGIITYQELRR